MKKLAAGLVCFALIAFVAPPATAARSLESSTGVASSRVMTADPPVVPPAEPGASGAIIRDEPCFENQLGGGGAWSWVGAERVDLPFTMWGNGEYWNDLWISPQGALSHDAGGIYATGLDIEDADLIWSQEVYAPMFGGTSATSYYNDGVDYTSPDFGEQACRPSTTVSRRLRGARPSA